MFNFKKKMESIFKEEDFECECCGSVEDAASPRSCGCSSGCGPVKSSCCDPSNSADSCGGSGTEQDT